MQRISSPEVRSSQQRTLERLEKAKRIFILVSELKACSSSKDLDRGRKIHARAVAIGESSNIYAATTLINMYCKCGSLVDARSVFDRMPLCNAVAWTALMLGYAENSLEEQALELFSAMQSRRFSCVPDSRTFVVALKACVGLATKEAVQDINGKLVKMKSLEKGMAVHHQAVRVLQGALAIAQDIYLGSALVNFYARCGDLSSASRVFDEMSSRNAVAWNALMLGYTESGDSERALELLERMLGEGCTPNARNFVVALKACSSLAGDEAGSKVDGKLVKVVCLEKGVAVHSQAVKYGCEADIFVGSTLVDVYSKCGSLLDSWRAFERMPRRNAVSWNSLMLGYAENGEPEAALDLFVRMANEEDEASPDDRSCVAALKACVILAAKEEEGRGEKLVKMGALEKGMAIHARAASKHFERDIFVANTLVDMYFKCGSMADASRVFGRIENPTVVSWTSLILGYVDNGEGALALGLFDQMQARGCRPSAQTFVAAMRACTCEASKDGGDGKLVKKKQWLQRGMAVHDQAVKRGLESNIFVASAAVDLCSKCGSMDNARKIFEQSPSSHGLASWNALMLGYVENGDAASALGLFSRLQRQKNSWSSSPNARTYAAALKACGALGLLSSTKLVHAEICRCRASSDAVLANSLVDAYGKCGGLDHAQQAFDSIASPDAITWNALITSYSSQGDTDRVFQLLGEMLGRGWEPSAVTYTSLLIACSRGGLVDRCWKFFREMESKHGVAPRIEHYHCVMDTLGRANRVEEAVRLAEEMPFEPSGVTWTTVLSACESVEAGRGAFGSLLGMEEADRKAGCALMSNLCSSKI
ncbi:pentatricopeptide repeat-containing protein At5g27110-like [Selaginella moellendorffii]|uniref:pentatricopeptide repeat-containing protein At5g27110-like n=1 Tax=Selaginella moellendorffii TaxID=88036 RepID=UPI000D1C5D0B|nr:pentatricopeptide repeat-containing protein At5g27110-like [Selaginella moellendorffii]|eukprot:XP_024537513.1 pentatricopeptide repeat-containing protein At5g27110-like [Selaginella moellendorffii]